MVWTSDLRIYPYAGVAAMGMPEYAARDLVETVAPIAASAAGARAVSGKWVDLSVAQFRLLRIQFGGTDQQLPPLIWPGELKTIECVMPHPHLTSGGAPLRTPRTALNAGSPAPDDGSAQFSEGAWTFTRMLLDVVCVEPMEFSFGEWSADVTWQVAFEEIGG